MELTKATTEELKAELAKREKAGRREANIKLIMKETGLSSKDLKGASDELIDFVASSIRGTRTRPSSYAKSIFDWIEE